MPVRPGPGGVLLLPPLLPELVPSEGADVDGTVSVVSGEASLTPEL